MLDEDLSLKKFSKFCEIIGRDKTKKVRKNQKKVEKKINVVTRKIKKMWKKMTTWNELIK